MDGVYCKGVEEFPESKRRLKNWAVQAEEQGALGRLEAERSFSSPALEANEHQLFLGAVSFCSSSILSTVWLGPGRVGSSMKLPSCLYPVGRGVSQIYTFYHQKGKGSSPAETRSHSITALWNHLHGQWEIGLHRLLVHSFDLSASVN